MQRAATVGFLLVLGSIWALQEVSVDKQETHLLPQQDFNLSRFMGTWTEVAVASSCPHYTRRRRGNPVVVGVELQHVASERNFTMTATNPRNGTCEQRATDYGLTNTPGRFFYHVPRIGADVDALVARTDYEAYAVMLLLSTEKPSGNKTTIVKLYSRSTNATSAALHEFKTLVRRHGINADAIILNRNTECVPGEQAAMPQILAPMKEKDNMVPPEEATANI